MIQSVHNLNPKNTGDIQSCPFEHFQVEGHEILKHDIYDDPDKLNPDVPVIIGGGGLLQAGLSRDNINTIISRHKSKVIIWGLGVNTNHAANNDSIPEEIKKASLVGVRDYGFDGVDYLPCVSCMNPVFDNKYDIKNEVVCFEGNKLNLNLPTMGCDTQQSMESIIEFLGSANTIVTSSYHGMYWGLLLGKRVIVIPNENSSKFYYFPMNLNMATINNWQSFIVNGIIYPAFLRQARMGNFSFANKVSKLLNVEIKIK